MFQLSKRLMHFTETHSRDAGRRSDYIVVSADLPVPNFERVSMSTKEKQKIMRVGLELSYDADGEEIWSRRE